MRLRAATPILLVAVAAAGVTAAFSVAPQLRFAWPAQDLRIAVETGAALIALIAAYLVAGRYRRNRQLDHLLLSLGLGMLAASNALVAVLLAINVPGGAARFVSLVLNLTGILLLAIAAFSPQRPPRTRRPLLLAGLSAAGIAVAVGAALVAIALSLPPDFFELHQPDTRWPNPASHDGLLAMYVVSMLGFATAAFGFARCAERGDDTFLRWLALAATVAAAARFHYVLFPPFRSDWLYSGDVLRLTAYLLIFVGAAKEISGYWRNLAETAVLEERRRIARDLHDGVAQELAFIGRRALRLRDDKVARQIAAAAERGLADSRRAIAALTRPLDEPLEEVLGEATREVGARLGVPVELHLEPGIEVGGDAREALVRIACEAVANAARHAGANQVRVELANGDRVRLRVVDDGVGFDAEPSTGGASGFGLVSMRERAKAVGGRLEIRSRPGEGTAVEVEL